MPIPSALQYASSIIGLVLLAAWVWFWYKKTPVPDSIAGLRPNSRFALAVTMIVAAGVIGLLRALIVVGMPAFRSNANHFLLVFGVTSLALAFWQLLLYCVLVSDSPGMDYYLIPNLPPYAPSQRHHQRS